MLLLSTSIVLSAALHAHTAGADLRATRPRAAAPASAASARVILGAVGRRIPSSFLGMSVEYNELHSYESAGAPVDRVLSLLHQRGPTRMVMRIGGSSADHTWWKTRLRPPRGVTTIDDPWVARLAAFVRLAHLRVLLDLNLAMHSPSRAASFVSATATALPPGALAGLEIGNEPNHYLGQPQLNRQRELSTDANLPRDWTLTYSPLVYRDDFRAYARALIARLGPISLGAPDITAPLILWLTATLDLGRLGPAFLAVHRYAQSTCAPPGSAAYPTVERLLGEPASAGLASTLRVAVAIAHQNDEQLRVTEFNSVSCSGGGLVADSLTAALWAPYVLFEMLHAGVDAVYTHLRPHFLNAPFQVTQHGIRPLPELYGLALFAHVAPAGARLRTITLQSSPLLKLKVWATSHGSTTSVVLINKGDTSADVTVLARATRRAVATVQLLRAPDAAAVSGIRYAGRWIGTDGRWHGHQTTARIRVRADGHYHLVVPATSAAVMTL